jgi:hypothetical protein
VSYETLARELEETVGELRAEAEALQGIPLAKAAERLLPPLRKLREALRAAKRGTDPDTAALREVLESGEARSALDAKTIRALAKRAMGKAVTLKAGDSPEDQRRRLLDAAVKHGSSAEVLTALKAFLANRARPAPEPTDREAVLAELWRLGRLAPEDLDFERQRLADNLPLLQSMASHAYVKMTARSSPRTIVTKLVKFAQRVQENTS